MVSKTSGANTKDRIFKEAVFCKLHGKVTKKWWCHGTTGATAYDTAEKNLNTRTQSKSFSCSSDIASLFQACQLSTNQGA